MIGADISILPQFEDRGRRYYDNGIEKDAVKILADHGFNYIRLRIFVNLKMRKDIHQDGAFVALIIPSGWPGVLRMQG